MSWWTIPVVGVLGVAGLLVGWTVGQILLVMRDRSDVWDVWDDEDL